MLIAGTGVFGSAVLSSGKRPWLRYFCSSSAAGPVVDGSAPPKPLDKSTSAWCSGTVTPSPALPRERNPSVTADFKIVSSGRLGPDAGDDYGTLAHTDRALAGRPAG